VSAKKKTTKKKAKTVTKPETVVSYKGFDANFKCRDFQYEVGATYETKEVEVCVAGFHACENPLDVLNYYTLLNDDAKPNRFAIVEQGGQMERHEQDSKVASARITITAELNIGEFIKRAVSWVVDACKAADTKITVSDDYSAQLAASGDYAKLAASGAYAHLAASGYYAKLAASGHSAQLAASGDYAQLAASGKDSVIASSSYAAKAKGAAGTWIALAEYNSDNKCIGFATGCAGVDGVPVDTWLVARGGKLVSQ